MQVLRFPIAPRGLRPRPPFRQPYLRGALLRLRLQRCLPLHREHERVDDRPVWQRAAEERLPRAPHHARVLQFLLPHRAQFRQR